MEMMFNFFRRKKKIREEDFTFLRSIVDCLPAKYAYLRPQVSPDFLLNKTVNPLGNEGTYTFTVDPELRTVYADKSLPDFFILKDIGVWNTSKNKFEQIELFILEGILEGIQVNAKYDNLDFGKIDISKVKEKHFKNEEKIFLKKLIGKVDKDLLDQLDVDTTFLIEIPEGDFYVIKDLEDGNYLAMNRKGAVFGLIHDPYEIDKIFDSKNEFFEALKSGRFTIMDYYEKKMS